MAKTTHATVHDVAIANLMSELVLKVDDAQRCQEIITRLSTYPAGTKLPPDVVDFIGNYAPIEVVDMHGLGNDVMDLLKKALDSLMKAISWIIEKLQEIFKYLFDSQYRACKQTLDLQRRIMTIATNPDVCTRFEGTNCSVVQKKDVDDIVYKTQELTHLIANCSSMNDMNYIDTLMKQFGANGGIALDPETRKLVDNLPNPVPLRNTTFGVAGWSIEGMTTTITNYLATIRGIESIKGVQSEVEKQAKDLKKRAEQASLGTAPGDVVELQREAAAKIMMTKTIGYAVAISVRRSENILAFLTQIYRELHTVASKKESKD